MINEKQQELVRRPTFKLLKNNRHPIELSNAAKKNDEKREKLRQLLHLPPDSDNKEKLISHSEPVSPLRKKIREENKKLNNPVIGLGPIQAIPMPIKYA